MDKIHETVYRVMRKKDDELVGSRDRESRPDAGGPRPALDAVLRPEQPKEDETDEEAAGVEKTSHGAEESKDKPRRPGLGLLRTGEECDVQ